MIRSRAFGAGRPTTAALHPSPAELADFALGSLDEERAAVIEAHVYRCDRCAEVVAMAPGDEFLRQLQASNQPTNDDRTGNVSGESHDTLGLPLDCLDIAELPPEIRNHPRLEIKRLIAEGAMGRVYLARARETADYVAVKVMRPEIVDDQRKVDRFLRESRIAEKLRHPNIAGVIGFETSARAALIAMEFVRGRTLAQIVGQRGPLRVDEAREYMRQAATGLAYAAGQGVVHRDIKPHNLMLDSRAGLITIVDFGLGRLMDEQRTGSRLTREDEILGTLDYISPEQAANAREADVRSDIYSLGCTFYYLLTGAPPFCGKNAVDLLRKHERERPTEIRSFRPDVPKDIANLIDRMMQKDPQMRPRSLQEILTVLERSRNVGANVRLTHGRYSLPQGHQKSRGMAPLRELASPAVLLPVLTCLICVVWLLFR